jgi:hypothetical protein
LKWLQIYEFLIEIIFILYLNTTLFYNCMLPMNRYLAMNTFCRSMTYYQKSHSLPLKELRPLLNTDWLRNKSKTPVSKVDMGGSSDNGLPMIHINIHSCTLSINCFPIQYFRLVYNRKWYCLLPNPKQHLLTVIIYPQRIYREIAMKL